ncbi:hypothetical protein LTS63_04850 [Mycobacterium intracellulare]|uniref:hypothetical protein n=1 Tax=Mycobacterium intracellulare TaxID=1767 RepID=UPI001CDA84CB|nr:hypothetical protein [Mycobacterium intracellulare]UGU03075.1 hypothetical protein LTS63_04850 [Mycobacterium intracellulare]
MAAATTSDDLGRGGLSGRRVVTVAADARQFANAPAEFFGHSWHAMQHVPVDELAALQLEALQLRFGELRHTIATLTRLADEAGIDAVGQLNDVVPLLFQHSVYKSYPAALLVRSRFTELTRWLDRLTTIDLAGVDVSECETIDAWLDTLEAATPLRAVHSSGTTGTMSFLPRSTHEWDQMGRASRCGLFQYSDPLGVGGRHDGEWFELIWPLWRSGRSAITRFPGMALPHLLGSTDRLHALRPGRMSSDAAYLAGRVRAAAARGELAKLEISPALRARREEFEREQREMAESLPKFINEISRDMRGRRIWMLATWNVLYNISKAGLDVGLQNVFASDSLITTGGGAKGQVVPDDWEQTVRRFSGVEHIQHSYVMSEITALNKMCERGRYHFEPWIVPFVLDPVDGAPFPRTGEHTGRMAVFDLLAATYWGGFVSGDEFTLSFEPCGCGRTTAHAAPTIERFSDKHNGDDKITCVAAEDAHRAALEFLTGELV